MGANLALGTALGIEADKDHPRAGVCRMQCQCNWKTGVDADAGYGSTRPKRGLSARFHDSFRNPLGDRTRTVRTPARRRYSLSANLLLCGNRKMTCPGLVPARAPSPKALVSPSPRHEKLNTGRNASNSRFFSDCYSAAVGQKPLKD